MGLVVYPSRSSKRSYLVFRWCIAEREGQDVVIAPGFFWCKARHGGRGQRCHGHGRSHLMVDGIGGSSMSTEGRWDGYKDPTDRSRCVTFEQPLVPIVPSRHLRMSTLETGMVTITVLYFASIREVVGKREETLKLVPTERLTLADVRRQLCELYPDARDAIAHITLARNLEYADDNMDVAEGDEIALIPPISGG